VTRRRHKAPRRTDPRGPERTKPADVRPVEASSIRVALVVAVAAKVAGVVLIFDPANVSTFEGPKTAFSLAGSAVLLGLLGAMLLRSNALALLGSRWHLAVGAFALANLLAVLFAKDQYVAIFGAQRRVGLAFVLDMVVLYLAVVIAYRTSRDWAILGTTIVCAGAIAIGYGVIQSLGLDPVPWVDDVRARPPSTFGNPDKFGHFLGATCAAALGVAVLPGDRRRRVRVIAALYVAASLGMAAIVATRGTILGLAVALPVLAAVYLALARGGLRSRSVFWGAAGAIGLAVLAVALTMATPLGERIRGGVDAASQQRLLLADAAIRAFADRPLTGHGPDNFGVVYPHYRPAAASPFVGQDSAHSWPLQALATTGALGALSLVTVVVLSLAALWRAATTGSSAAAAPLLFGAVAYWAHGLVAFGSVSVDWMGWLAAGGAVVVTGQTPPAPQRRVPPIVQAVVIGAGLVLALQGYAALQAGREAYVARAAGSPDRAVEAAERAVELDSGRAEYWFALGRAHRDRGALKDAALSFRAAAHRAPYVSAYWADLALMQTGLVLQGDQSLGGRPAALDAARRAVDADPSSPTPHHVHAVVANGVGDHAAALEAVATAIRLYKDDPAYDSTAADAASRSPDPQAARLALEMIIREKDSAVLRVALAQLSLRLNEIDAARMHLRRAIELDPANAPARDLARQLGL
jgi:O-antigen ligase